jgi:hypothetical protein
MRVESRNSFIEVLGTTVLLTSYVKYRGEGIPIQRVIREPCPQPPLGLGAGFYPSTVSIYEWGTPTAHPFLGGCPWLIGWDPRSNCTRR